jgi:CDP-diacylglycerol--inositol 3-phosphatidyltransferase
MPPRGALKGKAAVKRADPGWLGRHKQVPMSSLEVSRLTPPLHACRHVTLYIPNLIGYLRIALALYAFAVAFTRPWHTLVAYLLSFICDELDGRFARMLNQTSTLGAVLDMVTDRTATSGLLVLLAMRYPSFHMLFISLIFLDVFSHWFQMYSTLLMGGGTHKTGRSWLVRLYYSNRIFMGFCCVCCEVLWLSLFALGSPELRSLRSPLSIHLPSSVAGVLPDSLVEVLSSSSLGGLPWFMVLSALAMPGVLVKQVCNWVQLSDSVESLAAYECNRM